METKLLPKYTNAVKFALKVLDEAFIQEEPEAAPGFFAVVFSVPFLLFCSQVHSTPAENPTPEADVEDVAVHAEGATLEAKDMFSHRPLPFIIGTEPFFEDEFVGLMEEEEEEEEIIEEQQAVAATDAIQPEATSSAPIMTQASLTVNPNCSIPDSCLNTHTSANK